MKYFYFFVGTTAELIKLSPVIRELKRRKITPKIISSNQNTLYFDQLSPIIGKESADYTFKMKKFADIKDIYIRFIWWVIKSLGNYLLYFLSEFKNTDKKNIYFIVHGDTVTAFIGAVISKICRVKLIHIESGLRSFNFLEPFPEEFFRYVISHLADVHFCPNKWAINNLKNRRGTKVNTFANTISESTAFALKANSSMKIKEIDNQKYFVLVIHRQEHTWFNKKDTKKIIEIITTNAKANLKCVFVMHHLTRDYLNKDKNFFTKIKKNPNIILSPRLDYLSFVHMLNNAEFIATDGGSNQEEAYHLGKPCLILRNHTERIEGLKSNALLSYNDPQKIMDFMKNYRKYKIKPPKIKRSPSEIIVNYLTNIKTYET